MMSARAGTCGDFLGFLRISRFPRNIQGSGFHETVPVNLSAATGIALSSVVLRDLHMFAQLCIYSDKYFQCYPKHLIVQDGIVGSIVLFSVFSLFSEKCLENSLTLRI